MSDYHSTVLFFAVFVAMTALAAWALWKWSAAIVAAEEMSAADQADKQTLFDELTEAKRTIVRLGLANPGRVAESARRVAALNSTFVVRAAMLAALSEFQRRAAIDLKPDVADHMAKAGALYVEGHVNVMSLVKKVAAAIDQATIDADLDAAAIRATQALKGGASAPIDDVLDVLRDPTKIETIRHIPIRTIADLNADAKAAKMVSESIAKQAAKRPGRRDL